MTRDAKVMTDVHWARVAAAELLGWRDVDVTQLTGTSESSSVARVRGRDRTAVLKSFDERGFQRARLLAGLGPPFASTIAESVRLTTLAYEDLGDLTLGNLLMRAADAERRELAVRYVALIGSAQDTLSALGRPAPAAAGAGVDERLGIPRLTREAADWRSVREKLDAVARLSRGRLPDATIRKQADLADAEALLWARELRQANGRWIVGDSNPFNVLLGSNEAPASWRLVDTQVEAGIAEIDLMPLGGSPFNLSPADATAVALRERDTALGELGWSTLNGWFSLTCLCDSLAGVVTGSRDAGVRHSMEYAESDHLCLDVARQWLPLGHAFGHGWLPYVDWLLAAEIRLDE